MSSADTLFLAGDYEAQEMCKKGTKIQPFLVKHFIYSILISSTVNMPVGCYYQSKYTQSLLKRYEMLYLPYQDYAPLADFSIGDDRTSFAEDVEIKKKWFPDKYVYNDNESTSYLTKCLKNIQPRIRNGSMRKKLTVNISNDLLEGSPVRSVLNQVFESQERTYEIIQPLKKVIEDQKKAMLPPYIEYEMREHGLSTQYGQKRWLDFILFKGYSQSCQATYQCYCNNPLRIFYDDDFKRIYPYQLDYRDTNLFEIFIHIFPFRGLEHVERINPKRLIKIKYSSEFQYYLYVYQSLVDILKDELQAILLENNEYASTQIILKKHRDKNIEQYVHQLVQNTQDAITLYQILKNPLTRNERFKKNVSYETEFPALQLLSYVKSRILKEYIREVFQQSKSVYQEQKQRSKSMKNITVAIGANKIYQENKSLSNLNDKKNISIAQKEFQRVSAESLETFKIELFKNVEIDADCRKAVLEVLEARYVSSQDEYEKILDNWKKDKKTFPQKMQEAIIFVANLAGIGAFILELMRL